MEVLGWICLGLAGAWLVFIVIGVGMIHLSKNRLKHKYHEIDMLLAQRYNSLSSLANLIADNGGEVSSRANDFLGKIDKVDLRNISKERRDRFIVNSREIKDELMATSQNMNLTENKMYVTLIHTIEEVESQYRKEISNYASLVDAYNYWVKFIPIRLFTKLFRIKLKDKL